MVNVRGGWWAVAVVATVVFAACGGDDDDGATPSDVTADIAVATNTSSPATDSSATCGPVGLEFRTALSSCEEAMEVGARIVDPAGRATQDGVDVLVGTMCAAIQQTGIEVESTREDINLAGELSRAGVCPGDTSILVPKD